MKNISIIDQKVSDAKTVVWKANQMDLSQAQNEYMQAESAKKLLAEMKSRKAALVEKFMSASDADIPALIAERNSISDQIALAEKALTIHPALDAIDALADEYNAKVTPLIDWAKDLIRRLDCPMLAKNRKPKMEKADDSKRERGWKLETIKSRPGITYKELTKHGVDNGFLTGVTPEATVRSDIRRMSEKGLVEIREGRIYAA